MSEKSPTLGFGFGQWQAVAVGITPRLGSWRARTLRCGEGGTSTTKQALSETLRDASGHQKSPPTGRAEGTRAKLLRESIASIASLILG